MSAEHDRMIETLKEYVILVLREKGFKGSFPHFRRPIETAIHLLTFQFDKWGGAFTMEIAICPKEGITTSWRKQISPDKVRAWDIYPHHRLRLGPPKDDKFFRYDKQRLLSLGD